MGLANASCVCTVVGPYDLKAGRFATSSKASTNTVPPAGHNISKAGYVF